MYIKKKLIKHKEINIILLRVKTLTFLKIMKRLQRNSNIR